MRPIPGLKRRYLAILSSVMTRRAGPPGEQEADSTTAGPRNRPHRNHRMVAGAKVLAALISLIVVAVLGIAWHAYRSASAGITRSEALAGEPASTGSDQNILIMGLDSRRDQHGQPLPPEIYDALHAGNEDSADGDSDALIIVHLPGGDGPATAISIPRDDYVDLAGCPTSDCRGKIKEAYAYAYQRVMAGHGSAGSQPNPTPLQGQDSTAKEQAAREAGRRAEISTVKSLLQIPIDHFIEITLAGFFQLARVVEPITVCLAADTSDRYYSGADFHKGVQQISATQALAFVRQRRDPNDAAFTDLDRSRRQQAFIVSVVGAMRRGGTLSDPTKLHALLNVAKQNVAVDAGFDFDEFVHNALAFPDRPVALYTLPVTSFGELSNGAYVNLIDIPTIRSIVHNLVGADSSTAPSTSSPITAAQPDSGAQSTPGSIALDVVNASGRGGEATNVQILLATGQFSEGKVSTADSTAETSTISYGPGAKVAATELADEYDITATASDVVPRNTVRLTVGTDFSRFDRNRTYTSDSTTTTAAAPVTTVPATGAGTQEPAVTNLSRMTADGIPCVK